MHERNLNEQTEEGMKPRLAAVPKTQDCGPTVPFQTLTLGLTVPKITSSNQSKAE